MKKLLFGILVWGCTGLVLAQTAEETLHNRYWTYRDRFKKLFVQIGGYAGQSLPVEHLALDAALWNIKVDANFNDIAGTEDGFYSKMHFGGDVTAYLGDYIALLASEIHLLKTNGQEATDFT